MNEALNILSVVFAALADALAAGLHAAGRAALVNIHGAEWTFAGALAGSAWLISSGRGWRVAGVLVFLLALGAGAWLNWKVGRHGALAQQAVLAAMALHGLRGRGWAMVKGA